MPGSRLPGWYDSAMTKHLVVVPHTHWDREWWRTHEEFRYRLVRLVDRVLDLLETEPAFRHFTLDGQSIVLDDYLEVRPQARERIEKLVREGRLLVGPWYVLPDEWLVSAEALVRNLRLGMRKAEAIGGSMRLGYVPDQFGHVGQLPQIFAAFGFPAAILWRGVGSDVKTTLFGWVAPDGTQLPTAYMPQGYGNAALLPLDPDGLRVRLRVAVGALDAYAITPTRLLMNGSDHLEPQPGLPAALEEAVAGLDGVSFEIGTLPRYIERALAEAPPELPVHRGELRSGQRAPLLPGCASARAPQKRADFANDTLLTRVLEPLCAWLGVQGGDPDSGILDMAWKVALENHPHDSICGCSIDAVHDQMDTRFRRVHEMATTHLQRVAGELALCVAAPARGFGRAAHDPLVVWNPGAGDRAVVDAELELGVPTRGGKLGLFHLRDSEGRRIPVAAELLEPERELFSQDLPKGAAPFILDAFREHFAGHWVRDEHFHVEGGVLHLIVRVSELPSRYDYVAARKRIDAALASDEVERFHVRAVRTPRLRLRFADTLPGHGLRVYRVARGRAEAAGTSRVSCGKAALGGAFAQNTHWRVEVDATGRVRLEHRADGTLIEDALRVVSEGDRGDEYNFDPVPADPPVDRPEKVRLRAIAQGEARVAVEIQGRYRVPAGLAPDRLTRDERHVSLLVTLRIELHEGVDRVDVNVDIDNTARDHRLRLHVRSPFAARRFRVESAFEVAERPLEAKPERPDEPPPAERPYATVPQRGFASIDDGTQALTLAARGAAEVEAVKEADGKTALAPTLLRAVGWLSRQDLVLRPGHAGPRLTTPGAQVPGPQRQEFSLRLHALHETEWLARAHAFAHPPVAFPGGGTARAPLRDGVRLVEVDDPEVVVSAIEPRDDGAIVRLWNSTPTARRVRVAWIDPRASLEAVDLLEQPDPANRLEPAEGEGSAVVVLLGPCRIATLRIRR